MSLMELVAACSLTVCWHALLLASRRSWRSYRRALDQCRAAGAAGLRAAPCPAPDYLWSPGYWAWGGEDYYWVPGTWVMPPQPGYCGRRAIGAGAMGLPLARRLLGPACRLLRRRQLRLRLRRRSATPAANGHGAFFYNRTVNNIPDNVHITNVYNRTVVNNVTVNRVSFNGGNGGIQARPRSRSCLPSTSIICRR